MYIDVFDRDNPDLNYYGKSLAAIKKVMSKDSRYFLNIFHDRKMRLAASMLCSKADSEYEINHVFIHIAKGYDNPLSNFDFESGELKNG